MALVDPRIEAAAARLLSARHGEKSTIVAGLAEQLGCSPASAYRQLQPVLAPLRTRKRRKDAGSCAVTREEAMHLAALYEETRRLTGTGTAPLATVLDVARSNGGVSAGRVDETTGEFTPASIATVRRALRLHHVSGTQLGATTPAGRLSSPHPNWCWQIDASVSRQFYLADDGAKVMPKREFYRGKPQNFDRISDQRLWRYVVTDHASGCIEVFYVRGAESAANMIAALIHAMTRRANGTMHGVPKYLMADPGSAVTAGPTRNFVNALGIEYIINQVGNARAKGQVENAQYIVECNFEAGLKWQAPATSLEQINSAAQEWAYHFNATRILGRTGETRRDSWNRITPTQLVFAPPVNAMQTLSNSNPKACTVRDYFIKFGGLVFDVRQMPGGVINGEQVQVVRNALTPDSVRVLVADASGKPMHFLAPRIETAGDFGFYATAAQIGTEYRAAPETATDAARKELERLAMQVDSDEAAAAARKKKRLVFGGTIDPMKPIRATTVAPMLPRAGTASEVVALPEAAPVNLVELLPARAVAAACISATTAAMRLQSILAHSGHAWSPSYYLRIHGRFGDAVPEDELGELVVWLLDTTSNVRAINGGDA